MKGLSILSKFITQMMIKKSKIYLSLHLCVVNKKKVKSKVYRKRKKKETREFNNNLNIFLILIIKLLFRINRNRINRDYYFSSLIILYIVCIGFQ